MKDIKGTYKFYYILYAIFFWSDKNIINELYSWNISVQKSYSYNTIHAVKKLYT